MMTEKNDMIIREWLECGGGLCIDQMTNSLLTTDDEEEMEHWYSMRLDEYKDMSKNDYLKVLAREALEWAKIDEDKIAEYMDY